MLYSVELPGYVGFYIMPIRVDSVGIYVSLEESYWSIDYREIGAIICTVSTYFAKTIGGF